MHGRELLDRTLTLAETARRRIQAIPGLSVLDEDVLGVDRIDRTKLVIDVHGLGLTGFDVEREFRHRFRINPEMSDLAGIVCLITVGDTQSTIDRLVDALATIASEHSVVRNGRATSSQRSSGAAIAVGVQAMSPREAFFARTRTIPLANAVGHVSAELVIPYPPGIPVLAPGDVISPEKLGYLVHAAALGTYISGAADHSLTTINVVDEPWHDA